MITGNPVVGKVFGAANRAEVASVVRLGQPKPPRRRRRDIPLLVHQTGKLISQTLQPSAIRYAARRPSPIRTAATICLPQREAPSRGSIDHNNGASDRPRSRARPTVGPELLVVDEEGQSHDAAAAPTQRSDALLNVPSSSRSSNTHTPAASFRAHRAIPTMPRDWHRSRQGRDMTLLPVSSVVPFMTSQTPTTTDTTRGAPSLLLHLQPPMRRTTRARRQRTCI